MMTTSLALTIAIVAIILVLIENIPDDDWD